MRIDVLTLFPELFPGPLGGSIVGRAVRQELVEINAVNIRDFARDARGTVDEKPYGGGPGMLMVPDVLTRAVESVKDAGSKVILTSPRGEVMNQQLARELAKEDALEKYDLEGLSFAVSDISVELCGVYDTYEEFKAKFLEFVKDKPKYVKIKPEENPSDIIAECDRLNTLLVRASI